MQDYLIHGLTITVVSATVAVAVPVINQRLGKSHPVDAAEVAEVEAVLKKLGEAKIRKIKNWGAIAVLPLVFLFGFLLVVPPAFLPQVMFGHWDGFVLRMPTWLSLLPLIPGICVSLVLANFVAIWVAKAGFKAVNPGRSAAFLAYFGDGLPKDNGGYRITLNPRTFQRAFLKWSLVLYLVTMVTLYLTADLITETEFHKRGFLPFLNTSIAHEDLTYVYDEAGGDLIVKAKQGDEIIATAYLLGNGDVQAERMLSKLKSLPSVALVTTD